MPMQLSLIQGITELDLQANGYTVLDGYYPTAGASSDNSISEEIRLHIVCSSGSQLAAAITVLEDWLRRAKEHADDANRVYLEYAVDGTMPVSRSQVLDGLVIPDERYSRNWKDHKATVTIAIERKPYWEKAEVQIPLSNLVDEDNITGLKVYNPTMHAYGNGISFYDANEHTLFFISDTAHGLGDFYSGQTIIVEGSASNDGTYTILAGGDPGNIEVAEAVTLELPGAFISIDGGPCNYAEIAAADVDGSLPAPLRLEITNDYDDVYRDGLVWVGHNVNSDPANLEHILQAEDATGETTTLSALVSGCAYKTCEWSGTTETDLLTWDLTTELLNYAASMPMRFLVRFTSNNPTQAWVRLKIKMALTTIWEGPLVLLSLNSIQELATTRVAPYLVGAVDMYPLTLVLSAKHPLDGAHALAIDYLQMTPLDGWRKYEPRGYGFAYQTRIVDDGIEDILYVDWDPDGKTGHYIGYGEPIAVHPGKLQRLYFLHQGMTGNSDPRRTLTIKAFYRPRSRLP